MRVDELQRELRTRIESAPSPRANLDEIIRHGRRRVRFRRSGGALVVLVVLAAILTPIALRHRGTNKVVVGPAPPATGLGWAVHDKATAGPGRGTALGAVATTARSLLVAGARPSGRKGSWQAAIWYSDDGRSWTSAHVPAAPGQVIAIAAEGRRALAVGGAAGGSSSFVWRSDDQGRHWTATAEGEQIFGPPAPQMGRPFVSGLRAANGTWIATGGGSDGWAAVWTSRDGTHWDQVLDSASARTAGSIDITTSADGGLFGYWVTTGWYSPDGRSWGPLVPLSVPDRSLVLTVAPGVSVAFGANLDHSGLPTPLLRSHDNGRTWSVDPTFLEDFPAASVSTVTRAGRLWIAAGTSGNPNHPDAWVSNDLTNWHGLPESLYGAPGGRLELIGVVGDRIVLLGADPELDRYYTLNTGH